MAACVLLTGCLSREIKSGLTEQEAQEIAVLLQQNGVHTHVSREVSRDHNAEPRWTLKVRGGDKQLVTAWRILQENGLPRQRVVGLEEVFSSRGMIPTPGEEKARLLLALSGELTRTLKSVGGIVDARVQVVLPENSPLLDKAQWSPPTASVLVKHRGAQPPLTEDEVRRLVARGVEGMQPENVGVVYKRIEPSRPQPAGFDWYLNDAGVVSTAVGLMLLASIGALALAVRCRRQRMTIRALRNELEASTPKPQLAAESGRG